MITINVKSEETRGKMQRLEKTLPGFIDGVVKSASFFCIQLLMKRTPRKTGHARRGWGQPQVIQKGAYSIQNAVPYVGILDQGSRPHTIHPASKKALFFRAWKGAPVPMNATGKYKGWIYASVRHPGTKGLFFVQRSADDAEKYMVNTFDARLKAVIAQ